MKKNLQNSSNKKKRVELWNADYQKIKKIVTVVIHAIKKECAVNVLVIIEK
jgi:hypothetical protein